MGNQVLGRMSMRCVWLPCLQAHMAADVADAFCEGEVRLTVDQKVLFPNVDSDKISELLEMPFLKKHPAVSLT